MPGFREAGLAAAALTITGGVAYIVWNYVFYEEEKKKQPREKQHDPQSTKETRRRSIETVQTRRRSVETVQIADRVGECQTTPVVITEVIPPEKGTQVLVLGLDGAGKTSLLHCFSSGSLEQDVTPTLGFNAVSINREDLQIEFLEIGGTEKLRAYWTMYMPKAMVLVFVVDSSNADRFTLAKRHLHNLITSDPYLLPLVVLANKQDLPEACSITELHEALALSDVGDERKLFLIGTYVMRGDPEINTGVQDARDLILQLVCDGR